MRKDPNNWEYGVELATFYNNLAFFFLEKGDHEVARQQNHAALDTIEDLATRLRLQWNINARKLTCFIFI